MKTMKTKKYVLGAVEATTCGALLVATVLAQDTTTRNRGQENRIRDRANTRAGLLDFKTSGNSVRASKLIGKNIENSQQKNVGEINDIVLNADTGEIQYLAVTYGGFLGVGNKMFAVPFEAIKVQRDPDDPDDPDDYVLVMNVTQKQLEGAKGFDEDNWPTSADKNFMNALYKRYDVKRRWDDRRNRNRDRDVDVRVNRNGVDVDVDSDDN